jgi:hypothetical protein
MQNTGKRCVILLVFIILRWSFNYESNVFRYNKILIDCVFGNSKFVIPSTLTIDLGFASANSQCLRDNKLAIPLYPVNKYILFPRIPSGSLHCIVIDVCCIIHYFGIFTLSRVARVLNIIMPVLYIHVFNQRIHM